MDDNIIKLLEEAWYYAMTNELTTSQAYEHMLKHADVDIKMVNEFIDKFHPY